MMGCANAPLGVPLGAWQKRQDMEHADMEYHLHHHSLATQSKNLQTNQCTNSTSHRPNVSFNHPPRPVDIGGAPPAVTLETAGETGDYTAAPTTPRCHVAPPYEQNQGKPTATHTTPSYPFRGQRHNGMCKHQRNGDTQRKARRKHHAPQYM